MVVGGAGEPWRAAKDRRSSWWPGVVARRARAWWGAKVVRRLRSVYRMGERTCRKAAGRPRDLRDARAQEPAASAHCRKPACAAPPCRDSWPPAPRCENRQRGLPIHLERSSWSSRMPFPPRRIAPFALLAAARRVRPPSRSGKRPDQDRPDAARTRAPTPRLGNAIENGFKLYVQEQGGKLGGREIQYFKVDDESEPLEGDRQRQQADQARQRRRARRHRPLRRRAGDGQGGQGQQHAARHPERRRRRDHRADVRRRTSCAARSRTGSRATRWASSPARRASSGR